MGATGEDAFGEGEGDGFGAGKGVFLAAGEGEVLLLAVTASMVGVGVGVPSRSGWRAGGGQLTAGVLSSRKRARERWTRAGSVAVDGRVAVSGRVAMDVDPAATPAAMAVIAVRGRGVPSMAGPSTPPAHHHISTQTSVHPEQYISTSTRAIHQYTSRAINQYIQSSTSVHPHQPSQHAIAISSTFICSRQDLI